MEEIWPEGLDIPKERWHFCHRLFQRYSITLRHGEYEEIIRQITTGELPALKAEQKKPGFTTHAYKRNRSDVKERPIYIIYSKNDHNLVSVDRPEWIIRKTGSCLTSAGQ